MPHDDFARIHTQLFVGHLRERRFQALPVILDTDFQNQVSVRKKSRHSRLIAKHHRKPARYPFVGSMRCLFGITSEADPDEASVRLRRVLSLPRIMGRCANLGSR